VCDICLGWGRGAGRALADDELLAVRIALSAVGRLSGRFGVERVAQVLVGSRSREVVSRGLDRVPTHGKLRAMSLDEVKDLLGALADQGLIERHGIEGARPGAFVLALTPEGRAVALGKVQPSLDLPPARAAEPVRNPQPAPQASASPSLPPDPGLLARLKAWRTEEARRRRVPPYVVFHDSTLAAIAAARPGDAEALRRVKGVGPAKLEAYGAAVLRLVGASTGDRGIT